MKIKSSLILTLALLLSGCASYKLGTVSDPGFKTIFVENFHSDVDEPGLENIVTTTVIQQLQRDGGFKIVNASEAEVILRGRITGYETSPVRYARSNELTPIEVNLNMTATITLTRRTEKKPFFTSPVDGSARFFIGGDLQSDKRQGVPLAAEKIGQKVVSALTEKW